MRRGWRTIDRGLLRDAAAIGVAIFAIGVSFGAIAAAAGLPTWAVVAMSVLVFAGGAQCPAVGLVAAGSPVGAVVGGLLLNARHLPFGFTVAEVVGSRWPARLLGSHLMVDEAVAFALAQPSPQRRRTAYWLAGATVFVVWNVGTGVGIALGAAADPAVLGLDAAFPAGLLALLAPSLGDRAAGRVAVVGAGVALLTTPVLPAGVPVLLALSGLVVAGRVRSRPGGREEPE